MKELLKKITEQAKDPETIDLSEQGVRKSAKEFGYSEEQINALFSNFDDFPLDEESLSTVAGGTTATAAVRHKYTY